MDLDFEIYEESQDIFATHKQPDSNSRREPWNREYNCGRVSYEPVDEPVRCSASGSASLGLPSLRSERCAIFAELGTLSFPIPLLDKTYGIEFVFGRLFKVFRRLSSTPSLPLLKEYMQVLGLVDFIATEKHLDEKQWQMYRKHLAQLVLKLGPFSTTVMSLPIRTSSQNIPLHAALFSWSTTCKVFGQRCDSKPSPSDPCQLTVDDAFVVLLDGLAVLRGKCGSAVQCSCVQSVLKEIYKAQPSKFLETSFHIIQCSTKNECPYSERLKALEDLQTSSITFFSFFSEVISHLIDIRMILPEEAMARFALMSAMGDMLCDTSLQPTCKILLTFAQRYHLKGFMKIRKFASKFVPRILETVDSSESPELERLSQGDPARWTEAVVASLKFVVFEEKDMVTFLLLLLSDEQLSSCRGSLTYRYSSTKLLVSGTVLSSVMSLLLVLVAEIDDWLELPSKVCEWISGAIPRANDTQCIVLFNALEVLASLTNREGFEMQLNVVGTMISCLNALPLPERSRVFSKRYLSMLSTYPKQLQVVDINRYFNAVSISDVLAFLYLLADVSAEIPSCIWDKASNLLSTRPNDAKLRELVVNHLSAGMENKLPNSLTRFKETLDKMNSSAQVDPEFLFSFCNGVLSRLPPQLSHYANQLIPHWIFAVLAFSTSREMDTKRFTSLIWDHAVRILNRVAPNTAMELSPGDSEAFVVRFFEALGSCTAPADVVRRVVTEAVPFHLANQLATFVKSDQIKEVEERIVRVCGVILKNVGQTLLVIAEADAHRGGLNRTAFVIMTQTTVTKMVKGSMDAEFLLQQVPSYVAMLASLPYRIFVYSRMKDLIFKFGEDPVIGQRIYAELTSAPGSAGLKQLTKDSDQRIKNFLSKHADNQFDDFD